jgi:hypothetical protein
MNKLIKVFEYFYIINDDTIVEGDWVSYPTLKEWVPVQYLGGDLIGSEKKITHSTEKLDGLITLFLPEIIESIYGYNINNLSEKHFPIPVKIAKRGIQYYKQKTQNPLKGFKKWDKAFKCGFQAHQEHIKDKIVINSENLSSLQELVDEGYNPYDSAHHLQVQRMLKVIENFIESVTPKTVWNITIDENNKITML